MKCYTFEGVTLTEEKLYQQIKERLQKDKSLENLKYAIFNIQDDTMQLIEKAHKGYNQSQSVGVHSFINLEHNLMRDDGTMQLSYLSPSYNLQNRILNSISQMMNKGLGMTREEAEQEIRAQINEESGISDFGTLMHELFSIAIKARIENGTSGCDSPEFLEALSKARDQIISGKSYVDSEGVAHQPLLSVLTSKIPGGASIEDIMSKILETCKKVEASIFNGRDPRTIYKSEYQVSTTELIGDIKDKNGQPIKNLRGVIDLLIVNPNGEIEIIDFKVASRGYSDWYAAKQADTDYQLATYRQILAANGINGKKVSLNTFPIYFPLGNVMGMNPEDIKTRTSPNVSSPSKNLDWETGTYTKKLKQLVATILTPLEYENITLKEDIEKDIKSILGTYNLNEASPSIAIKDEIVKSIWPTQNGTQVIYNIIDRRTGHKFSTSSKEKMDKFIDDMLRDLPNLYSDQIKSLVKDIKKYQASNNGEKQEFELLNSSTNSNINIFNVLNGCFGKYCNSNYTLIEIPELLDLGIFLFQNKVTGLVEAVRVTDKNIRTEISICDGSTVLGKFVTNNQAQHMSTVQPLKASIGNVQLIETMAALNQVAPMLQQFKLAAINIINPHLGQRDTADLHILRKNFKYLITKADVENNFDKVITIADTWEVLQDSLSTIISNPSIDSDLRQVISGLDIDTYNVQEKIKLIENSMQKLENRYSQLRKKTFLEKRSFETPQEKVYLILSLALLYYKETPVRYDGKLSKWGLHPEEIIRILGTPFLSQYKGTLNNGFKAVGFLQGLDMGTPTSVPSQNLSALYQFWQSSFQHIRDFTLNQTIYLNKITTEYYKRHGVSNTSRAVINSSSIWESFIERGVDGKFTKELCIVNPDKTPMNEEDKLFLNQMLWEMQKFILPGISEEQQKWRYETHKRQIELLPQVIESKSNGRYYQLPLRRASNFDRMRNIKESGGIISSMKRYWESLKDDYDPRQLHSSAQKILNDEFGEVTEMFNQYKLSERARNKILENENVYDFELDMNLLAIDVAFQHKRKELFDECLTHAAAMATIFHYLNDTTDANFDAELQNLDDEANVMLKNKPIISEELQQVGKGIGLAKRITSLMVLGIRPFQFIKEITYGQFVNYSRAWALKGSGQEVSAKSILQANKYVWGLQAAGWLKSLTGEEDLASFTMIQLLNKKYGMANEDLNNISKNNSLSRTGMKHGLTKYMYIFSSAPDFFNRMSLFIAKMIEDGCFDAHSVDENGNLKYDIKKDKRFSKLVQLGLNSNSTDKEYLQQRALYRAMLNDFIKDGYKKEDGTQLNLFDENLYLPRAYTNREVLALKEVSDQAYGYYDHEAKSLNDQKFFGLVFKQFMAFWTSKTQLWLRAPGSQTTRGRRVPLLEDGKPVYVKYIEDPETHEIIKEYTTENPDGTLEPELVWEGEYVEGLIYSIGFALRDILTCNWTDLVNNKQRIGNLKLALHDILIGIILYNILRFIFSGGTGKQSDMHPVERTLVRAMQDTGPQAMFGLSITPSFVQLFEGLKQDIPSLFSEDPDVANFIRRRFGFIKDITWQQH